MMEIALGSTQRRWGVVLLSLAIAAILIPQACILWLANHRLNSNNVDLMERGAKLTPGEAAGWDRVGRLRQFDLLNPDLSQAIADYQAAVRDEPYAAHYWMDLAAAYEAAGDDTRARDAFARAKTVYPASGEVAFNYGNFLLRQQKYAEGFAQLRQAVSLDSALLPVAISRSWKSTGDVNQILDQFLPAKTEAYAQAVDFFASSARFEAALTVWQRLIGLHQPFELTGALPLLERLIQDDRADDARAVWLQALVAAGLPHDAPANGSLIWNGDFARDFANGGLDWRWSDMPGADFSFDSTPNGNGRAVRVDFSGGINVSLSAPAQYVPVEPGRSYHFHALMRTDRITTESGMQVLISPTNHKSGVNISTENFTGSHDWTPLEADVITGPETHFLLVQLIRRPSRLFENKLDGTVWIADVTLVPSNLQNGQSRR